MKSRQIFSLLFILLTSFSSAMVLAQTDFELITPDAGDISCHIIEEDDGAQQEFKESVNPGLTVGNKVKAGNVWSNIPRILIQNRILKQYKTYQRQLLSADTSPRKFIDLGSFLI